MLKYSGVFLLWLVATSTIASSANAECLKTMAWSDDYPYSFKLTPEATQPTGINIKTTQTVFKSLNCSLRFSKMPFARALVELEQGRIDIIGGAFSLEDRHAFALYSNVRLISPNVLFLRNNEVSKFPLKNLTEIQKYQLKLGVQIGVSYSEEYEKLLLEPSFANLLSPNSNRKALWKMMSVGRIDAVVADLHTGLAELKQLGLQNTIKPSQLIISNAPSYYIFSKKTTDQNFVNAFDSALKKLDKNGVLEMIQQNYD